MAIQSIEILKGYMTCEDPAVRNKYYNLLDSFWHKTNGDLLLKITETSTYIQLDFTNGKTVSIPKMPDSVAISFVTGLQDALGGKVDKELGKGLSTNDFTDELLQKLNGLGNYVHPEYHQISEVQNLQEALDGKVDKEPGKELSSNDFTNALKAAVEQYQRSLQEQIINSGGNYNGIEVTAGTLIFTNENAQAIVNGFKGGFPEITLINRSASFLTRINSNSSSVDADAIPIDLPNGMAQIGVRGTVKFKLSPSLDKYEMVNAFGIPYAPEHLGITETQVIVVNPDGSTEVMELEEMEVYRNAQTTPMSKAELNTDYADVPQGFMVNCVEINTIYKKADNSATGEWESITTKSVS